MCSQKKDDRTEKTWWIPLQNALFLGSFRNFLAMTKKLLVPPKKKKPAATFSIVALASVLQVFLYLRIFPQGSQLNLRPDCAAIIRAHNFGSSVFSIQTVFFCFPSSPLFYAKAFKGWDKLYVLSHILGPQIQTKRTQTLLVCRVWFLVYNSPICERIQP